MFTRYRYSSLREGLVGHWRPSRGATGNTLIDSVRGNHGTLTNGPTWQGNGGGLSLSFDGTNDYVDIGTRSIHNFTSNFSFGCWFNSTSSATTGMLINRTTGAGTSGYELYLASGIVTSRPDSTNASGVTTSGTFTDGRWHHAFVVYSASSNALYVDGVLIGTNAFIATANAAASLQFGARAAAGLFYNGLIDDCCFFNRPLTASEIQTLYTAGRGALDQRITIPAARTAAAGPATFKAAWAKHSNVLVGV